MSIEALLEDEPKLREISLAAFKQLDTDCIRCRFIYYRKWYIELERD